VLLPCTISGADTRLEGHRLQRFPLRVWAQPELDADVEKVLDEAFRDWNAVFREALGAPVEAFVRAETKSAADVFVADAPPGKHFAEEIFPGSQVLGFVFKQADDLGMIRLPVSIYVRRGAAIPKLDRRTALYVVVAHELGHALGLGHTETPGSIMYWTKGLGDSDVRAAREQLAEHYSRFWGVRR